MPTVAVVGAGVNGLATAWALAKRGVDVTVYEQFRIGHTRGSSHGASRIFRLAYPDLHWVRLAQEAFPLWRELEAETGETILELRGFLELVRDPAESSRDALKACGIRHELLDPADVAERFPLVAPREDHYALFQPDAGIARADKALRALRAAVEQRGARVEEERPVGSLADVDADVVVVAAGSWARKLLAAEGIDLPVVATSETVCYFRLPAPPPSVVEFKAGTRGHGYYALYDPLYGLKAGLHKSGSPTDPDVEEQPSDELAHLVADWVAQRFPAADTRPADVETCLYTNADDERFVLERHGRIVVASACSGHGFKFAPAVGERVAGLAADIL